MHSFIFAHCFGCQPCIIMNNPNLLLSFYEYYCEISGGFSYQLKIHINAPVDSNYLGNKVAAMEPPFPSTTLFK